MKSKPIKIDWESLEEAFSRQHDDIASYLDRVTGHVVLEGEGEDELDDENGGYDSVATPARNPGVEATRLYVQPPDTARKVEWMKQFLAGDAGVDAEVAAEIAQAITTDDPGTEISAVLNRHAEVRDVWYVYRTERVQELIDGWLADNGVVVVDPPPWQS